MRLALDTTSFRNAVQRLGEGLVVAEAELSNDLLRDGVIQRFKYTYELSHKVLRRYLEETEPAPEELRTLNFPALIRLGSERGLRLNGWDVWTDYRKARGTTSQACDSSKARGLF